MIFEAEWPDFGGASGFGDGSGVVVVDMLVLSELEVLFERDVGWTRHVGAPKRELQKKWGLFKDELRGLQMTVPTYRLILVKFVRDAIKKNESLVEEVEALPKMVTDEKAEGEGIEKKLTELNVSVAALNALAAKFAESKI